MLAAARALGPPSEGPGVGAPRTRRPRLGPCPRSAPTPCHAALETVIDPEIRKPVTELGMVESVAADDAGHVAVTILLTVAACPLKDTLTKDTTAALAAVEGVTGVTVTLGVMSDEQRGELKTKLRGGVAEREVPFARRRLAHPRLRRRVRQGRRRQVVGHRQPRGVPGRSRACGSASSTPTSTASRSPACSGSPAGRPRSTT